MRSWEGSGWEHYRSGDPQALKWDKVLGTFDGRGGSTVSQRRGQGIRWPDERDREGVMKAFLCILSRAQCRIKGKVSISRLVGSSCPSEGSHGRMRSECGLLQSSVCEVSGVARVLGR